ncbi:TrkH family potassium uptake protein [Knoellia aerolata]|uniref:TrkH family potassium uptake protein n=1 Tax=Knoellia aerolata TaxID=442954 RepID=UPI000A3F33AC|nr:potassium transporter TrkG [Knoellia aerolata]
MFLRRVSPGSRREPFFRHPAQVVAFAFAAAGAIGTVLLMLPTSRAGEGGAPFVTALFTATSAVCVTGLTVVDTAAYWTVPGQAIILALIQVGGFGIMTLASLIALFLSRRMGLRTRLTAAAETRSVGLGDVRRVLRGVFLITVVVESAIAVVLTLRFRAEYDDTWGTAAWHGLFHAVSAFNNAGFALFSDNLMGFLGDGFVLMPISVAIIIGGLGFPVLMELLRTRQPRTWSLHTRLTLLMTVVLLVGGTAFITLAEWGNPGTLGPFDPLGKLLGGWFHAVQPRTAGFNAWDYGVATDETLLGTIMLMFIGGGSAGTAGGLKVTTFIVLFFVIVAEVRGDDDVIAFDRRIEHRVVRQAITVALLGVAAVIGGTMVLTELTDLPFRDVLFETTSAFATVGLSTGITPKIGDPGQFVLVALMFLGRLGPITLVSALALRERNRRYRYPEGAPLIG